MVGEDHDRLVVAIRVGLCNHENLGITVAVTVELLCTSPHCRILLAEVDYFCHVVVDSCRTFIVSHYVSRRSCGIVGLCTVVVTAEVGKFIAVVKGDGSGLAGKYGKTGLHIYLIIVVVEMVGYSESVVIAYEKVGKHIIRAISA